MPRFAANLTMMYTEWECLDRFEAAARDGFKGVEILFPYDHAAQDIRDRLSAAGHELALINVPPGDPQRQERGLASLPGREADFDASIAKALDYAATLGTKRLHVLAGLLPASADRARHRATYVANLARAADAAKSLGITVLIEPINPRDIPGYFLNTQAEAHAIRTETGRENIQVQMDLYHCQIVEGDLTRKLERYVGAVGHIQIAGVPDRHEPDVGEVNYPHLFEMMDRLGYTGWVGCEYRPRAATSAGLGWLRPFLR